MTFILLLFGLVLALMFGGFFWNRISLLMELTFRRPFASDMGMKVMGVGLVILLVAAGLFKLFE